MKGRKDLLFYSFGIPMLFFLLSMFFARPIFAVLLPLTPITQHLPVADHSGDTGRKNCTIAAYAMVFDSLVAQKKLAEDWRYSYQALRTILRSPDTDVTKGVSLFELEKWTPVLTKHTIEAQYRKLQADTWTAEIAGSLENGFPVLVYITDWRYLEGHYFHGKSAHVIVVTGLTPTSVTYADSWDGKMHTVSQEYFAQAWGNGHHRWHAVFFSEVEPAQNFGELTYRYFSQN